MLEKSRKIAMLKFLFSGGLWLGPKAMLL